MEPINWEAHTDEAIHHLRALLRIDTTNPPGNETLAAAYLAEVLQSEGIESAIVGHAPRRGNLVARLKGSGEAPPLLLMGHIDVVPAEPEHWTHPPFAGEIADGHIWGRGALDMKSMVISELMVMLALKRQGVQLARDVIYAACADEEVSGLGMRYLVREHPDLIRAEYAINEGGGVMQWVAGKPVYPIQAGEKGVCWTRVQMRGTPGHAAVPKDNNAVVKLTQLLAKMRPLPQHVPATVRAYVEGLAQVIGGEVAASPALLLEPAQAQKHLEKDVAALLHAITRNTATPTGLKAGYKTNVVPSEAQATLDCRFLPGFDRESFLDELRAAFPQDLAQDAELEVEEYAPALEAPYESPLYRLMKTTIEALHPGATAVPYLVAGATDAKWVQPLGIKVYGFAPLRFYEEGATSQGVHGHDERIPIDGFAFGLRALYTVVRDFVCARP